MVHEIMDTEIARSGIQRHNRIAVQRQSGQSSGNNAGCLVIRLVRQVENPLEFYGENYNAGKMYQLP
jgi:hypothetical protein